MKPYILDLNLIDLISEKHKILRETVTGLSDHSLNHTETHILAKLELHGILSISEISRIINISRQGAQKCMNGLLEEGYVEIVQVQGNSRDKNLTLTPKGLAVCQSLLEIKNQMEQRIAEKIGLDHMEMLKKVLSEDWL